jgi:predicted esterase
VGRPSGAERARLRSNPGRPSQPALPAGLHELAAAPVPPRSLAHAPRPAEALLVVPPRPAPGNPLLVFFHGAGSSATGVLPTVRNPAADAGCLLLLPTSTAATWDVLVGGWGADVQRLDDSLHSVFDRFEVTRVAFGGFSDGASYALSLGLANGDLAPALLAFSPGFAAPPHSTGRPRIFVSHGTDDRVLPIARCGRPVARRLRGAGYDVTFEEFDGAHVVPRPTLARALRWWLEP